MYPIRFGIGKFNFWRKNEANNEADRGAMLTKGWNMEEARGEARCDEGKGRW